jgi:acetyl-CoA carboxylase carboxyl transferase subunit alpha
MTAVHLDFERPIVEKEREIEALRTAPGLPEEERARRLAQLEADRDRLRRTIFSDLTPIQRVQLARHPRRPYLLDYVALMFEDWLELHGDRAFADDQAMVGGLARLDGLPLLVIGQQKGRDTKENLRRNFGMPHPEGYRKALRLMKMAEKFHLPVVSLIDTPGAYPGVGAEERGQAEAIARNLREMAGLPTPVICVVTGEGGSGGALAIGVGNRVLMLEYAVYSVISPEGCAAILWGDAGKAPEAAEIMKITARDLLRLGVIDAVVPEAPGGAHRDWDMTAANLKAALAEHLGALRAKSPDSLVRERYEKFRRIGVFEEESLPR